MRKFLVAVLGLFGLLVAVLLVRTFSFEQKPTQTDIIDLPEAPQIDSQLAAARLSEAISFQTITYKAGDPQLGQEGPWLTLHAWLEETYPAAHAAMTKEVVPGGYTLLYTWQGSDTSLDPILLMAHQDVVPVTKGTESQWTGAPFAGEIIDGYVYGRGAIDDKSSLVSLMEAAEALAKTGFTPKRTVLFMFGHDEEVSGLGAEAGVALLKSRGLKPAMVLDEGFMVVDDSPLTGKRMGFIGVAEKGYLTLELVATATGGHSSTPPRESATVRLSRAIVALDENQMPSYIGESPTIDLFKAAAPDMPFSRRLVMANMWLFGGVIDKNMAKIQAANAMVRTTTAPTMLSASPKENVLAQRAVATINFRIHPNDTKEGILSHVNTVIKDIPGIEIGDVLSFNDATPVSPDDNQPYKVLESVAYGVGEGAPVTPALVLGGTDSRYATEISRNVYRFMPGVLSAEDLTGFHGTNERLSVENMGRMSQAYSQIILAMDAP